jgi:hypothetical protein
MIKASKFAIAIAAVASLAIATASAQTNRQAGAQWQSPYANQDTRNLRFGHANDPQFDPYVGTVFDDVYPY